VNSGLYAACAALIARTQSLDVAANNLANVNTAGYKSQQPIFRSILAQRSSARTSVLSGAVNDFAVLGGSRTDSTQGSIERTANDFDCAIDGPGFFAIQTKAGTRYTRDGRFQLSSQGLLVTAEGDVVLGEQGPIRLPSGALSISNDGTVSVDGALAGKLRIIEFASGTPLVAEGRTYYVAPAGSQIAARNSTVKQGAIEASNVNPVSGAVDLIVLQRHADLLQRALTMFHSDFNRIAAEDLPRV
jgi:flagellar basal-body rod protein FlgF